MRSYNYIVELSAPAGSLDKADLVARSYGYNGAGPIIVPGYCSERAVDGSVYYTTTFYGNTQSGDSHPDVHVQVSSRDD